MRSDAGPHVPQGGRPASLIFSLLTLIIQKKQLAPASAKKSVKKFLIKGLIIG
jgi:hypothetical protein